MASSQLYDDVHLRPSFAIKLDGTDMPVGMADDVLEIVVEQSIHMPHSCTIRLHEWDIQKNQFKWVDDDQLKEGKSVEVQFGYTNDLTTIFKGEITMIEMDAAAHMVPNLVVHCMSKDHRLQRNRVSKTYQQVTDSDIVQQVASQCGLTAMADSLTTVRDWVCQYNQTNYEFLKMCAHRNGCRMYADGNNLIFEKIKSPSSVDHEVAWGDSLRSFRPRLTTHGMVSEVDVKGWDMKQKQAILSRKSSGEGVKSAEVGESSSGGEAATNAFGDQASHAVVDIPVNTQDEADSIAQAYIDNRETSFIGGDGLCVGHPAITAGKTINVKGVGNRFSGKYAITSATHTFTPAEGYTTQFSSSGKTPNTIPDLLAGERVNETNMKDWIAIGLVTDNQDPDNLGRIKVQYPWLMDDTSFWARMASPMAGNNRGIYYLPEVGDEVLVAFEHGDIHSPYMIGALWNGQDSPVEPNSSAVNGGVVHRVIKTRAGHTIMLDDTNGQELVKVTSHAGHYVLIDDGNKKIVIADSAESEKMTIDISSGDVEWVCNGNFKITANQKVQIQGQTGIDISTPAQVQISGDSSGSFTSSGTISISGSMVNINS
ncbi:MAG TPA: VgrG-related protein [Fimbriimonadaceae bacterium]|nr:VgrG-related protein [Fimbriimonadaceae bacterium]